MDEEPDGAQFLNSESDSSAGSQSLLSRHLFSVQNQVRALQTLEIENRFFRFSGRIQKKIGSVRIYKKIDLQKDARPRNR